MSYIDNEFLQSEWMGELHSPASIRIPMSPLNIRPLPHIKRNSLIIDCLYVGTAHIEYQGAEANRVTVNGRISVESGWLK